MRQKGLSAKEYRQKIEQREKQRYMYEDERKNKVE